jgi:RNA polymerase sigma-70 factor (ECF subfamily)
VDGGLVVADVEEIWRSRRSSMVAAVAACCGSRDLAVDAVDEAFARALAKRSTVESMASPGGWILTVAINAARRGAKRSNRRRTLERVDHASQASGWIEPTDPRFELWSAVRDLPDRQRMAVALRYLADLTEPQIAEVMGIAVGTVGSSLTAARRTLAARLAVSDDDGSGEEGGRS